MRWTARHQDGFCSRLLRYTLDVNAGIAELEASWSRPEPSIDYFRSQFPIDDTRLQELIPKLREAIRTSSDGDCWMTDASSNILIIRDRDTGCGIEYFDDECFEQFNDECYEQFAPYREFFSWLEKQVISQLPLAPGADMGPFN